MGVTGRPAEGTRYVVERAEERSDRVVYRGFVHLPDADLPLEVVVELPGGATLARVDPAVAEASDLEREAAALVRSATKSAVQAARALPRRIARWRG